MSKLVPKDHSEEVALFRSQVIGPLAQQDLSHGDRAKVLRELSQKRFRPPGAQASRTFSVPTLERWLYAYKKGGLVALQPAPRKDRGHGQKLNPEQKDLLCDIRREHPMVSADLITRTLVIQGLLDKDTLTPSTLRRFYKDQGLDSVSLKSPPHTKLRLRWQAQHPGALWHGDVCHGPTLTLAGTPRPLRVHALLDDASRFIVAIEAHHTELELDMLGLLCRALRRYGAPDALYLDNGATYRGEALRLGCERLGITLLHARPYDAPARGKMERFWRTLRQGCLDFIKEGASLHDVNVRLWAFLDQHYHTTPHGALMGNSPAEVFDLGMDRPADLLTEDQLRDALTVRERRRVKNDNTLSVAGCVYELDQGFLSGRVVTVLRCLVPGAGLPQVEHEGKRLLLHPVDPIHNATRKRTAPVPPPTSPKVPFDPATTLLDRACGRSGRRKEDKR
jgi:putative transposase